MTANVCHYYLNSVTANICNVTVGHLCLCRRVSWRQLSYNRKQSHPRGGGVVMGKGSDWFCGWPQTGTSGKRQLMLTLRSHDVTLHITAVANDYCHYWLICHLWTKLNWLASCFLLSDWQTTWCSSSKYPVNIKWNRNKCHKHLKVNLSMMFPVINLGHMFIYSDVRMSHSRPKVSIQWIVSADSCNTDGYNAILWGNSDWPFSLLSTETIYWTSSIVYTSGNISILVCTGILHLEWRQEIINQMTVGKEK